jgi:L-amino acid N-acyltransferase YncA
MVNIRRARPEDEARVIELLKQFPEGEIIADWDSAAAAFREIMKDGGKGSVFVAEEDGDVLGVVAQSFPFATRCAGIYSCIEEIIVDDKGRGRGVGGKLLEAAIAEATEKGCHELQVNRPSELGYPMYLRHGLQDLGKHLYLKLPRQTV